MTVKDYLKVHRGDDVKSVGIYKTGGEPIDTHVKTVDLVKYEDLEVDHVHLFIYDKSDVDIQGNPINLKYIRACIYVR